MMAGALTAMGLAVAPPGDRCLPEIPLSPPVSATGLAGNYLEWNCRQSGGFPDRSMTPN